MRDDGLSLEVQRKQARRSPALVSENLARLSGNRHPAKMKSLSCVLALAVCFSLNLYANPAAEKEFIDKYKTAFEAKDTATLESLLYTQGSDSSAIEFYKVMMQSNAGGKISSINLVDLTPEDAKKAAAPQDGPTGKLCLVVKPTKKLVVVTETKDENGTSSSTNENFVAEKDGKIMIPVPGACK